ERAFTWVAVEPPGFARDQRRRKVEESGVAPSRAFPAELGREIGPPRVGWIPLTQNCDRRVLELGKAELGKSERPRSRAEGHGDHLAALGGAEFRMLFED